MRAFKQCCRLLSSGLISLTAFASPIFSSCSAQHQDVDLGYLATLTKILLPNPSSEISTSEIKSVKIRNKKVCLSINQALYSSYSPQINYIKKNLSDNSILEFSENPQCSPDATKVEIFRIVTPSIENGSNLTEPMSAMCCFSTRRGHWGVAVNVTSPNLGAIRTSDHVVEDGFYGRAIFPTAPESEDMDSYESMNPYNGSYGPSGYIVFDESGFILKSRCFIFVPSPQSDPDQIDQAKDFISACILRSIGLINITPFDIHNLGTDVFSYVKAYYGGRDA